jgi:hypothetical protein
MRDLFSWRLTPSETELSQLWETATFIFDTNVLLDLYGLPRSTVENFFAILQHLEYRVWLPYQVAEEFLRQREELIESEVTSFHQALLLLEQWKSEQKNFHNLRCRLNQAGKIIAGEVDHVFEQQQKYFDAVDEVYKAVREKLNNLANQHISYHPENDFILENILSIFDCKVGEPYDEDTLQSLYEQAEDKYNKLSSPGCGDMKQMLDEPNYSDFILWQQILNFAKRKSVSIIFVTSEQKQNWWLKKNSKIVSPNIELRREFHEYVKQKFWMYSGQDFVEIAKEELALDIAVPYIRETNTISYIELMDKQDEQVIEQVS